jgi:hypothetical protein
MKFDFNSILQKLSKAYSITVGIISKAPLKLIALFVVIQLAVVLIAFLVFGLMPVNREVNLISGYVEDKPTSNVNELWAAKTQQIKKVRELHHHEAFLTSTLQLSKIDSISLLIDLSDSIAILTFKGVKLFETKILSIDFNKGLKKLPLSLRDSLYSGPMMVVSEISSLEKFPIVIKKAPKDTTEANILNSAPQMPKQHDVFYQFDFGNNMLIEIKQHENELIGTAKDYRNYTKARKRKNFEKNISALTNKNVRGYTYSLTIELAREDARSIYRALPVKPFVVVRY